MFVSYMGIEKGKLKNSNISQKNIFVIICPRPIPVEKPVVRVSHLLILALGWGCKRLSYLAGGDRSYLLILLVGGRGMKGPFYLTLRQ